MPVAPNEYVHLHGHSMFSVNDGMCRVDALVERARELGFDALALTEHGRLGSAPQFAFACKDNGIRGITGCEMYLCKDLTVKQTIKTEEGKTRRPRHNHIPLLCKTEKGFHNLVEMMNIAFIDGFYHEPRIDWELLEQHAEGLVALSGCLGGEISRAILNSGPEKAREITKRYLDLFGEDFFLEIQYHGIPEQVQVAKEILQIGKEMSIPVVATQDYHYLYKKDAGAHDIMKGIRTNDAMNSGKGYSTHEFHLKSAEEMYTIWKDYPEVCRNTLKVAERCAWQFPTTTPWQFPAFQIQAKDDFETWHQNKFPFMSDQQAYLTWLCLEALEKEGLHNQSEYKKRLQNELSVIFEMSVEEYFLILWDIFAMCHERGIGVGPGRGCLTGDTLVMTKNNGYIPLKDISSGDVVFTHDGSAQEVTDTMEYPIEEDLLEIKTDNSLGTIKLTRDHKVWGTRPRITERYTRYQESGRQSASKIKKYEFDHNPEWIEAGELKPNDYIFMPWPERQIIDVGSIDLSKYASENFKEDNGWLTPINPLTGNKYNRKIRKIVEFDEEFAYFLGRWVGDGWFRAEDDKRRCDVGIAFRSNDKEGISRICAFLSRQGLKPSIVKHSKKQLVQVIIYSTLWKSMLQDLFPKYKSTSDTKHIGNLKYLPDNMLLELLRGLHASDGHVQRDLVKGTRYCIDTTSRELMLDIREALLYLRIQSSVVVRKPYLQGKWQCKQSYKIRFKGLEETSKSNLKFADGYYAKILSIDVNSDYDRVYDITVANNHSYLTQNYAVHNSGAGSLVLYLLKITLIDPIEYGLYFERFLNEGRSSHYDFELKDYPLSKFQKDKDNDMLYNLKYGIDGKSLRKYVFDKIKEDGRQKELWRRVKREILPLENQGMDEYYMAAWHYVQANGAIKNTAHSWIAYAIGICDQKPKRQLRVTKMGSLPDVDSDFEPVRRDEVTQYCRDKYGENNVVNIGTYGVFRTRSTLQGVLKHNEFGFDHDDALQISKVIPFDPSNKSGIDDALQLRYVTDIFTKYKVPQKAVDFTRSIEGSAFSSVSEHAAGVVIAPHSLHDRLPMHLTGKKDLVTQYDLNDVEKSGYIKFDFLGLNNVGKIQRCIRLIKQNTGIDIDVLQIDKNDKKALSVIGQAITSTIFQLSSKNIRKAIRDVKVDSFDDIVAIAALYRPGPMRFISRDFYQKFSQKDDPRWHLGMTYAENKANTDSIEYLHEDLAPILGATYGILTYQEQAMEIVQVMAGFTLSEADVMRKAIGKKKGDLFEKCRVDFFEGAKAKGYDQKIIDDCWKLMEKFSGYAFNKAHATAYALLALWNAFLLSRFPHEWYAACITEDAGNEDKYTSYILEAKDVGIKFIKPNVNISGMEATVQYKEDKPHAVVLPLIIHKGVGKNASDIVKKQPFDSFMDFCRKVDPNKTLMEILTRKGACRDFGDRLELVREYNKYRFEKQERKKAEKTKVDIAPEIGNLFETDFDLSISAKVKMSKKTDD